MDLGLSLRSSFNMESSVDEGGTRIPERSSISMEPCWIGLGRAAQDDHVQRQQELGLLPFSTIEKQQENPRPPTEQRFLWQESRRKLQKASGGTTTSWKQRQHFGQGVGLPDVNTIIPVGEAEEETAVPGSWMGLSDEHRSGCGGGDGDHAPTMRKKLRLSKDQSAHLEATFRNNTTLNPKLKVDLARKLNLGTRQVEVWFQNRRARTKLKQTEVECEYLKRWCERLTEDNRQLQRELKALRASQSLLPMHPNPSSTASTLTTCSSCTLMLASPATKPGEPTAG